jgi:vitamin B12 transporter
VKNLLPICVLAAAVPFALFCQTEDEGGFFPEAPPVMEGEGITLEEDPLITNRNEIAVLGTEESTQQMEVIGRDEIERRQAPDLPTLLEETLDMGITRYGAYGNAANVNIRGLDSSRVAILIDGIPVNSPRTGGFDMSMLDLNSLEKIEVIYGGSDTKFNVSGAMGGVINLITIKKQEPGLRISGGVSNLSVLPERYNKSGGEISGPHWEDLADTQMASLSLGYGAEKFSWSANWFGNRAANHYLYKDYGGFARRKENNEVWDTGTSTSFVWDLPGMSRLLAGADIYYADRNFPYTGTASTAAKQRDLKAGQKILLDMPRAFRDDLAMEASLSHTFSDMVYGEGSRNSSHYMDNYLTAINRWSWYPNDRLAVKTGVDYRYIRADSQKGEDQDGHDGGIYLNAEVQPAERFLLIASLKGVANTRSAVPVPKLGFVWKPLEFFTLKNNYFRSFKYPDFDDLYWKQADGRYVGNPDLKPEDGWGADLGAEFHPKWFSLGSVLYYSWINDSIHWVKSGGVWSPRNAGIATYVGLDTRLNFDIPLSNFFIKKVGLSLSYQYQLNWLLSGDFDYSNGMRIPYMPMHTFGASADFPWETGSLLISGHYESLRYADTTNLLELDPYFLLNVTVNQKIGGNFTAFMIARNLLNTLYTSFAEYPMPGITLTLGIRINFEGIGNKER